MTVKVRFAPSPTGRLHIGNVRTAVLNWLFALKAGGTFILRLDDTDRERSREEHARAIVDDLEWLGLRPSATYRQSERLSLYAAAAERLKRAGLLYPCHETEHELALKRKAQLMAGRPPVYDRAALRLSEQARRALEEAGHKPYWRFRLPDESIRFHDAVRGEVEVDLRSISDPVLVRADGSFLYTLPSVVDDMEMGISHVIRGDDHLTNTAVQIALCRALGGEPPVFAHHGLLRARDGGPLSKRLGSLGVADLRARGLEPETIVSWCATIGSSLPVEPYLDMRALAERFALGNLSRAPARFDEEELLALNARLVREMPCELALPRLRARGIDMDCEEWEVVRANVERLEEAAHWWRVLRGEIAPAEELGEAEHDYLEQALALLPEEPWDETTWKAWTAALREKTGRRGRALFLPLRLALTGRAHGPEMSRLLPLMGRERAVERLRRATMPAA